MKTKKSLLCVAAAFAFLLASCGSNNFKGSASDRTGTNGATNGTGKVAPLN